MTEFDDLTARLRALGTSPVDPAVASEHLTAMAALRRRPSRLVRAKVVAAFAAGLVLGGTGLASAGVMGGVAQDKVADAATHVGVNLPGGTERSTEGCGTITGAKNHGQYVRQGGDPKSTCGKPLHSVNHPSTSNPNAGDENNGSDNAACKPPWAGSGLTKAQREAARANADAWRAAHPECASADAENESNGSHGKPETTPTVGGSGNADVTPPGGGQTDNAGVPSGGSIPGKNEQGEEHRVDEAPPASVPGDDNRTTPSTTTTTVP